MRELWAFVRRDVQNEISYSFSFLLQILSIFPLVLLFLFISRLFGNAMPAPLLAYGGSYFPFVLIGIAVQNYLMMALSSFAGSIRDAQLSGTLEAILTAPVRLPVFLLGSMLYAFVLNSLRIVIYLVFGILVSGAGLEWTRLPSACLVMGLTIAAFSSLGILSASFIILFKKGDPLNWMFNIASWLLGGVYYPVSVLPGWLREASEWIPMTHSLEALRLILLSNHSLVSVGSHVLKLALWASICLPVSYLCFRYALNRARATGTLGHY